MKRFLLPYLFSLGSFLAGCQGGDSVPGTGPVDRYVASDSFLLRLTSGEARSGQMDILRSELSRRGLVVKHEYGDAVGLLGTLSVKGTAEQMQAFLHDMPVPVESQADLIRYTLATSCKDGTCDPTCSVGCPPPVPKEQQDELSNSWHVRTVGADKVWAQTRGEGIHVAVLDTGFDKGEASTHPDRPARIGWSYNFALGNGDWSNTGCENGKSIPAACDHGTHVAGLVGAPLNGFGSVGIAPDATMHIFQVFTKTNGSLGAFNSDLIAATEAAIRNGYHIISMSLGGPGDSPLEHAAVRKAYDSGILVVVAAGNGESYDTGGILTAQRTFPGAYPESMSVGATDITDHITDFSSQGSTVTVSAPGMNVYSSVLQGNGDPETKVVFNVDKVGSKALAGRAAQFASTTKVTAQPMVNCGHGSVADVSACAPAGKIALIRRGPPASEGGTPILFTDKLKNARAGGATGVILYNHRDGDGQIFSVSFATAPQPVPVATLAAGDGEYLAALLQKGTAITLDMSVTATDHASWDGTSMATPIVSGVAALVWSRHPELTNVALRQLLTETAVDLGAPGRDDAFGWGRIDAARAMAQGAPRARCGDGRVDLGSEICDPAQTFPQTCEELGWDKTPGDKVACNDRCTAVDLTGCKCSATRDKFDATQTVTDNATQGGQLGTLAVYHVKLNGQPVRGAFAHVTATQNGKTIGSYDIGPSDANGDISDFTPYDKSGWPVGALQFSPVITKGGGRCHDDQPVTPASYTVNIKS